MIQLCACVIQSILSTCHSLLSFLLPDNLCSYTFWPVRPFLALLQHFCGQHSSCDESGTPFSNPCVDKIFISLTVFHTNSACDNVSLIVALKPGERLEPFLQKVSTMWLTLAFFFGIGKCFMIRYL